MTTETELLSALESELGKRLYPAARKNLIDWVGLPARLRSGSEEEAFLRDYANKQEGSFNWGVFLRLAYRSGVRL